MLRVVVAVVLTVALLAVTLPALETARHDRSAQRVQGELDGLTAVIRDVHTREDAVPAGRAGARRVVTIRLPARTWTDAGVEYVAIGGSPPDTGMDERTKTTFAWQVTGQRPHERRLDIPVEGGPPNEGPLIIRSPGVHRLAISRVRRGNRTVVVVQRLSGTESEST